MEYDPASPTDEPEDIYPHMDLSSIPLPGPVDKQDVKTKTSFLNDIPLPPPTKPPASSIPLPLPAHVKQEAKGDEDAKSFSTEHVTKTNSKEDSADLGPLKFSLKVSKQLTGQENANESSGVFESMRDLKSEEPRAMPKLQAMMKRSKPCQLPVGVLPSKTKLPATEVKMELFLPTKESENTTQPTGTNSSVSSISGVTGIQPTDSNDSLTNAIKEINALNNLAQMASGSIDKSTIPGTINSNPVNGVAASLSLPSTGLQIPNLMSINVQPIHPGPQNLSLVNNVSLIDTVPVVKPPKVPPTSMQFVNPQKFRSAQMIATPLIANPAVAAQSQQNDDQPKSKDARRRGRSRSRSRRRSRGHRRSRSRRRSDSRRRSRHRRSSSSRSSSHRRSTRRRSRSHRTPKDRHRGARDRDRQKQQDRDRHSNDKSRDDVSNSKKMKKSSKYEGSDPERADGKTSDRAASAKEEIRSKEKVVQNAADATVDIGVSKSGTPPINEPSEVKSTTKNSSKSDHKSRTYRSNKHEKMDGHSGRSSQAARKSKSPVETSKKESHEHVHAHSKKAASPLKGTLADLIKKDRTAKEKHSYRRSAMESSESDSDTSEADGRHHRKHVKKPRQRESLSSSSDSSSSGDRQTLKPQVAHKKNVDPHRHKHEESPQKRHQFSHTSKSTALGKA